MTEILHPESSSALGSSSPQVTVSIVSHLQAALVRELLDDLQRHCAASIEVIVTVNAPESVAFEGAQFRYPVIWVRNPAPKGFGANHNAAFRRARGNYFCVMNPDIRLQADPFPPLVSALADPGVAVAAPLVCNSDGAIEDSARIFPTPGQILRKALSGRKSLDYVIGADPIEPDWVAGMFMLFRRETFAQLGGFDERFHLYYEDVDLCARARLTGLRIALDPRARVVHQARRASHRQLRFAGWHARSMLRFFLSGPYRRLRQAGALRR